MKKRLTITPRTELLTISKKWQGKFAEEAAETMILEGRSGELLQKIVGITADDLNGVTTKGLYAEAKKPKKTPKSGNVETSSTQWTAENDESDKTVKTVQILKHREANMPNDLEQTDKPVIRKECGKEEPPEYKGKKGDTATNVPSATVVDNEIKHAEAHLPTKQSSEISSMTDIPNQPALVF